MMTFDQVLPTVLRCCHRHAAFGSLEQVAVIRDLKGRVRLVVRPRQSAAPLELESLRADLDEKLEGYFAGNILCTQGQAESARLAANILSQCQEWPTEWPEQWEDDLTGATQTIDKSVWCGMQRLLSKQSWLGDPPGSSSAPPWPPHAKTPGIVSFYSFKGGVGRSTLLAATAWRFARAGKKVAVIDLDLEAPGLAALFDVETRRGVLDFIVDHLATGKSDLTDCFSPAPAHPGISVFPAGAVSWSYLEKLGRLDFAGSALAPGGSAVETALRSLLQQLKREIGPDLVLIDSRSGLHDIGGLSLHGLAHLDVLVSRANAQSFTGLSIALRTIVHRRGEDTNVLVVQSFAPVDEKTREAEEGVFLTQVYQRFSEHLYASPVWGNADAPSEDADDAPHAPCVILESEALARLTSFGSVVPSIWEGEDFVALCDRIQERLEPDEDVDEEGGTE